MGKSSSAGVMTANGGVVLTGEHPPVPEGVGEKNPGRAEGGKPAAAVAVKPAPPAAPAPQAPAAAPAPPTAPYCDLHAAPTTSRSTLLWYAFMAAALFIGWRLSSNEYLVAEEGPGYYLGILGGSLMLLLLVYPLRKKARFMRNWGPVKYWFKAHMVLGVIGPALVVFHANFRFGSANSTMALLSTLLVAGSGFVGRYFYAKIHYGLYGRKMSLAELKKDLEAKKNSLAKVLAYAPRLQERLFALDASILKTRTSFLRSFGFYVIVGPWASWTHLVTRIGLRRAIDVGARRYEWSETEKQRQAMAAKAHISAHISNALRIAEFSVYERLLALWHLFHFPLFLILVAVGVMHVVAVHMY